ncbi:MSMEG_0565 family glycosyltransferase [Kribbella sp. NPDC051770]|uniref:MSMEG_0565 family glycosyltransferase n=1 Tax=Kribbella sp. NPDC051770 TaxID=3155413 RepID=UPI003414A9C7
MRIALLSYSTKPRGGVVHTLALAEALAARGEDVTVFSLGRGGDTAFFRPIDARVKLRVVPFPEVAGEEMGPRILRSIAVLRAAFDGTAYDVVHAQDCISANAAGRCIRTVHHLDQFTTPELAACHERAIVTPSAHLCVSAAVAAELADGWGLKATVIPNGVDAERFAAAAGPPGEAGRQAWREELGRYVVTVGGIEPRKGSLELLEAFALVDDPELKLVIAGGETLFDYRPYREAWDRRAAELGVTPVVLGPVDDDRLPTLVAAAETFAFPSVKEGFGLAPMEALAAGVPLVVSDLPVFHEIFGPAATYASTSEELATALTIPVDADRRAAGQALAASYTWQAAAEAHLAFYRSLEPTGQRTAASAAESSAPKSSSSFSGE